MSIEIQPYFADGERYPALIGVRAEGDEYETAYVSKSELMDTLAENAKLRKLALDLYEMGYPEWPSAFESAFADRMRELGFEEVDE